MYDYRYQEDEEFEINGTSKNMPIAGPRIDIIGKPFICVCHYHFTFKATEPDTELYWMINGAYEQGRIHLPDTKQHTFDLTILKEINSDTELSFEIRVFNGKGPVKSIGNNSSLNFIEFINIPANRYPQK